MAGAAEQSNAMQHLALVKGQLGAVATMTRLRDQVMTRQRHLAAAAKLAGGAAGGNLLFMVGLRWLYDCSVQDCSVQTSRVHRGKNRLRVATIVVIYSTDEMPVADAGVE